jgi:hypothetical protein
VHLHDLRAELLAAVQQETVEQDVRLQHLGHVLAVGDLMVQIVDQEGHVGY